MVSFEKLVHKGKIKGTVGQEPSYRECLLKEFEEGSLSSPTPTGFFAVYVGEERRRFAVPTSSLSHPLFKMLLEKSCNEFGFEQSSGLVVPCSVSAFQEILKAVECSEGKFELGKLVEELI